MKAMKFIGLLLLGALLFVGVAYSEGLLPGLEEVYGVEVPSFTDVIKKFPQSVQETEQGISLTYFDVTDKHYYSYGEILEAAGCEVKDYSVDGETIKVIVSIKGKEFSFSYDSAASTMTVLFPEGVIESPQMTPTPTPAPTPTPTPAPTETPKPVIWSENAGYSIDLGEQNVFEFFTGQKIELKAVIKSLDNSNHNKVKVIWETSDESIATVNNKGQVIGIAAGDAIITCRSKADNDVYSLVFVHVKPVLVGDTLTFGHYEQDNNMENGPEKIEWMVLKYDAKNQKVLLLSKYGLDAQPYHNRLCNITWEKCSLRAWLNNTFLNTAFTQEEQKAIMITKVDNSVKQGYEWYKGSGGKNTQDRVFLLSFAEADKYLGVSTLSFPCFGSSVTVTEYAIAQGAWENNWWLRSPGYEQNNAAVVHSIGKLYGSYVNRSGGVVRPALWLNLNMISSDLKSY